MIKAQGGKYPYVYAIGASRPMDNMRLDYRYAIYQDVADSDDEAAGRAAKFAKLAYPTENGWGNHFSVAMNLGGVRSFRRMEVDDIVKAEWDGKP